MNRSSTEMLQLTTRRLTTTDSMIRATCSQGFAVPPSNLTDFEQNVKSSNRRSQEPPTFDRRHVMLECAVRLKGAGVYCDYPSSSNAV